MRVRGQVIRQLPEKGFGFIEVSSEADDVLFYMTQVPATVEALEVGMWLEFEIKEAKGKLRAKAITIPGAQVRHSAKESTQRAFEASTNTIVAVFAAVEFCALVAKMLASGSKFVYIGLAFVVFMNGVAAALFWLDKNRASKDEWRIPERQLIHVCLLGGWPTGWFMMLGHRHKIRKESFLVRYFLAVLAHLLCIGLLIANG